MTRRNKGYDARKNYQTDKHIYSQIYLEGEGKRIKENDRRGKKPMRGEGEKPMRGEGEKPMRGEREKPR